MTGQRENADVQALYRHVNERIAAISRSLGRAERLHILCECGSPGCAERLEIGSADYERVRAQPTHFALLEGHEDQAVEDVIARASGYLVVANHGVAATVARRTDPRAGSR